MFEGKSIEVLTKEFGLDEEESNLLHELVLLTKGIHVSSILTDIAPEGMEKRAKETALYEIEAEHRLLRQRTNAKVRNAYEEFLLSCLPPEERERDEIDSSNEN